MKLKYQSWETSIW